MYQQPNQHHVLLVQNSPHVPPAAILPYLESKGITYDLVYSAHRVPRIEQYSHIICLGGEQGARDNIPEVQELRRTVNTALKQKKPLLGLCLGSQVIADALGYKFLLHGERPKEFGMVAITPTALGIDMGLYKGTTLVLASHEDGFEVPSQYLLANNEWHQAFQYENALGIQYHPEQTPLTIGTWCQKGYMFEGRHEELQAQLKVARAEQNLETLLDHFLRRDHDK